jgi:DNA-binding transcriptional regulator GbsR (MarR family)
MCEQITYPEARTKFIESWGDLAPDWGVSKTMGSIHALLLISNKPMCCEEVMKELDLSKSNVNINLRTLMEWGLIYKNDGNNERKDYYYAEKNLWKVFIKIVQQRKKKELDPMIALLGELKELEPCCDNSKEFCNTIDELKNFSSRADSALQMIVNSESNFLVSSFVKMIR